MKSLTTLVATLLVAALPAGAALASSGAGAADPATHSAVPAYRHYVACGLSQNAKPSHRCHKQRVKGAFFRSNVGDVAYTVCVRFPTGKLICTPEPQEAKQGTLYVNKITTNIPGKHKVTWFVSGKRVGIYYFTVVG
jgi:hypothetical protein